MTSTPPTVSRRTWWVVGAVGVIAMTAVAIWFGLAATSGKVSWYNAGFSIVSTAMQNCLTDPEGTAEGEDGLTVEQLEKLFLSLA